MLITHATQQQIALALEAIQSKYDNNLMFNNFTTLSSNRHQVTLRVRDSRGKGARLGSYQNQLDSLLRPTNSYEAWRKRRHMTSACWHVHGGFFEALFALAPEAVIISRGSKITQDSRNWEDYDIGSVMYPYMASEACEC